MNTNASPDRISRGVRRNVTGSTLDPGTGGTCVPGDQAAIWIHQDPLPRADEECRPGQHADGLGQPVPAAQATDDDLRGEVRPPYPRRRTMKQKQGKSGGKMLPKNELPGIRVQKTGSITGKSESR